MRATVAFRDLDLDATPESELRAAHAVAAPLLWSHVEGDDPAPFEEWRADARRVQRFLEVRHVTVAVGGEVAGYGLVELDRDSNTHIGWGVVGVVPDFRRQGIGTRLLDHLVAITAADGRRSFGAGADEGSPGEAFLAASGLTHRQVVHLNRLDVDRLDRAQLEDWVARAGERAAGYELRAWDGPTPPELVEDFAVCTEVMNTAPTGDLDLEDEHMSPERLRTLEQGRVEAGIEWWTLCAIERDTGRMVGFTQLSFSPWRPWKAKQNDTGVDPAHRDKGLGRWLKAVNLLRVLDERPDVRTVDTGNAGSNAPMLGINHALGFRLAKVSGNWQGDVDVIRRRLQERLAR